MTHSLSPAQHAVSVAIDDDTRRAVAVAYRNVRRPGDLDPPAREAAIAAYRERFPETGYREAHDVVAIIIAQAAREHPKWFWKGVHYPS